MKKSSGGWERDRKKMKIISRSREKRKERKKWDVFFVFSRKQCKTHTGF